MDDNLLAQARVHMTLTFHCEKYLFEMKLRMLIKNENIILCVTAVLPGRNTGEEESHPAVTTTMIDFLTVDTSTIPIIDDSGFHTFGACDSLKIDGSGFATLDVCDRLSLDNLDSVIVGVCDSLNYDVTGFHGIDGKMLGPTLGWKT